MTLIRKSSSDGRRINRAVTRVERMPTDLSSGPRRAPPIRSKFLKPAVIVSATAVVTSPQDCVWRYTCNSAHFSTADFRWVEDDDPIEYLNCYNPAETPNDGSGVEGIGEEIGTVDCIDVAMGPLNTGLAVFLLPQKDENGGRVYVILGGYPNPLSAS